MVSKASDDLPDPLTPVMTMSDRAGSVRSTFFRLCVRAPRTVIWPRFESAVAGLGNPELFMVAHGVTLLQPRRPCLCYFDGACRRGREQKVCPCQPPRHSVASRA